MAVGESRSELLAWLNATFALNYTKVEQCGTGAAYCLIMESIYGGVPLSKIKSGSNLPDYDARNNMKVLQACFNKHHITKQIETERLIRCRLQDNLELLQWFKRHWAEHVNTDIDSDAPARRRVASGGDTTAPPSRRSTSGSRPRASLGTRTPPGSAQRAVSGGSYGSAAAAHGPRAASGSRVGSGSVGSGPTAGSGYMAGTSSAGSAAAGHKVGPASKAVAVAARGAEVAELSQSLAQAQDEIGEYRIMTDSLETERNFYFNKLREIEILTKNIQTQYERADATARQVQSVGVLELMAQIQEILYSTEKGFEVHNGDSEEF